MNETSGNIVFPGNVNSTDPNDDLGYACQKRYNFRLII